ncbi:glycosyltransferase family 2 protein [Acidiferrimicrobium sp. IK]|uniref:glycosyltransferase family 2 protein n=1 Tax=Acidiferrimicrobium sp. IK TaxID=2871700 RepID=UPI0021CB6B5D|nr:glycosyltransferase family 2 protein [Acidiferrimicrobium sp. IK]MCU4185020.1 glycosyltransferase family 2 protein [Acidiferrimicrobium sp. IK]
MARLAASVIILGGHDAAATRQAADALRPTLGPSDQCIGVSPSGPPSGVRVPRLEWTADLPAALRAAQHGVVVVLHPSCTVTPRWIDPLVEALRDPSVGAAGPRTNEAGPQSTPGAAGADRKALRQLARDRSLTRRGEVTAAETLTPACIATRRARAEILVGADGNVRPAEQIAARLRALDLSLAVCEDSYVHVGPPAVSLSVPAAGRLLVSACLIVKDEEDALPDCLRSLMSGVADEAVVYDTGSTDRTVEVARRMGARVVQGYWDDDFARARNAALAECRGQWVVWLDADETLECTSAAELRDLLVRTKPEFNAWSIPIHNLVGMGVGAATIHNATRLFRRDGAHWVGRLHEQVMRVDGTPLGLAALEIAHIRHTGYLDATWVARDKTARNLRIAAAEAAADADPLPLLNLARSLATAGRHEEAIARCAQVAERSANPIQRRVALRTGASSLLELGRPHEVLEWVDRLRALGGAEAAADGIEASARLQLEEFDVALACLDRVGPGGRDEDGFTHTAEQFSALRAQALAGLGRPGDAADEILASLAGNDTMDAHIGEVAGFLTAAGRPLSELVRAIPEAKGPWFMAQMLQLDAQAADELVEAALADGRLTRMALATAASLAPRLPLERVMVWSARLRAAGLAPSCPLVAIAASNASPVERARAAAVAVQMFSDERAVDGLKAAIAVAGPAELDQMRAEVTAICPALAGLLPAATPAGAPAAAG